MLAEDNPGDAHHSRQIRTRQARTREDAEVIDDSLLPEGWTLARVREIEPSAELLDPADHHVVADERPASRDYKVLRASAILSFSGLCLCLVSEPGEPDEWWMGQLDSSDGSIACWSDHGPGDRHPRAVGAGHAQSASTAIRRASSY